MDQIRWLQHHRGDLHHHLDLEEMGGAPSNEEEVRRLSFLRMKIRALEKAGLAFYISNALADRYEYLSPIFQDIFCMTAEEAQTLRISEFSMRYFEPEDLQEVLRQVHELCAKAEPDSSASMHVVSRFNIPGRGLVWLEQWQTIYFDHRRAPVLGIACLQDVTAQKRAEAERDRLLDCVLHDLRNPLTILRGYLSILDMQAAEKMAPEHREILHRMVLACDKLSTMTSDILALERSIHGTAGAQLAPTNVPDFFADRLEDYRQLMAPKEMDFVVECPADLGAAMMDTAMTEQVVENLLTNAVKYSFRGGRVVLEARRAESGAVEIRVIDDGVGVPDRERDRLFREFSRLSSTPTEGESSTGLGLAICKRLVEAQQGTIWHEPAPDGGSIFAFSLRGAKA